MLSLRRSSGLNLTGKIVKDKESEEEENTHKEQIGCPACTVSYTEVNVDLKTRAQRQDVKITELGVRTRLKNTFIEGTNNPALPKHRKSFRIIPKQHTIQICD